MSKRLEVLFTPAEFYALARRDLSDTICVVFDVLRATTSIVTDLGNGAREVIPAESIEEALNLKTLHPDALLAGERNGFRITRSLTGTTDFDLGNSPREFSALKVEGRSIIMTTTNGSRALRACRGAAHVVAGCFLNMAATADACRKASNLIIVCSGTHEEAAYEDTLAAGSLADKLWENYQQDEIADSARIARHIYIAARGHLIGGAVFATNGRRLMGIPELKEDVDFCLRENVRNDVLAVLRDGSVIGVPPETSL